MNYKQAYFLIEETLSNLQISLDHEEWTAVLDDRVLLTNKIIECGTDLKTCVISSIEDKTFEKQYKELLDEAYFYLNLASDELQDNFYT